MDYPYELTDVLFSEVQFKRKANIPENVQIQFTVEMKFVDTEDNPERMQVNLRVKSLDNGSLDFLLEVIGLYKYLSDDAKEESAKVKFFQERGFFILWAYVQQLTRIITSNMGMQPLNIPMPQVFNLEELKIKVSD